MNLDEYQQFKSIILILVVGGFSLLTIGFVKFQFYYIFDSALFVDGTALSIFGLFLDYLLENHLDIEFI